ncbi:hypothetical protein CASFOL_009935 [Castilleja foliolosa]|uniref:Late embryogenesis abundant protein LEA-2 subgroup domain-containing protein n=1 Tax=Castilleja foliolosa TaxID=1961234 RepID=A0ABD3DV59_9LAMI
MAWTMITVIITFSTFLLSISAQHSNYHNSKAANSPYKALQQYNFPVGLLPKGATGYTLNSSTGEFSVRLNGSCSFALENSYQLKYKPVIKGVISRDRIQNLSGVSVKVLVMWLNIVEIKRDDEKLEFSVGITTADFPVGNFEERPQCGCGFDCEGGDKSWASS